LLIYGLLFGFLIQAAAGTQDQPEPVRQVFAAALDASDIRSQGPFLLEAKIAATGNSTLEGKYRLIFESESLWREDVVIGSSRLIRVHNGEKIYTKSEPPENAYLLQPFQEIGNYPDFRDDPVKTWQIKEQKKSGQVFQCLRAKSPVPQVEPCFLDGLYIGDPDDVRFSDFREVLGKKYPFSWKKKTDQLSYAGTIERIVKANIAAQAFAVDDTFRAELSIPCNRHQLTPARLVSNPRPVYPPIAKASRVQGSVIMKALIKEDGSVNNLRVISGHPMLVQSALDAVRQWHYDATLCEGKPIPADLTINVNYSLSPW
jgi:TonB family protein